MVENKIVENNLQLHAHMGSGFDTWIVQNNLDCDKRIVSFIKNGKGIIEMKVFSGYIEKKANSSISSISLRYDSFELFFGETWKNFQIIKRIIKSWDEPQWSRW